jgi:hypothetical protein
MGVNSALSKAMLNSKYPSEFSALCIDTIEFNKNLDPFLAWFDKPRSGEELLMVFKILRDSNDFTLIISCHKRLINSQRIVLRIFNNMGYP